MAVSSRCPLYVDCTYFDIVVKFIYVYEQVLKSLEISSKSVNVEFNACKGADGSNNDLAAYHKRLADEGERNTTEF